MDTFESDFENFSLSDFIFVFEEYPITSVSVRIRKEKTTSETILNLSLYLLLNDVHYLNYLESQITNNIFIKISNDIKINFNYLIYIFHD